MQHAVRGQSVLRGARWHLTWTTQFCAEHDTSVFGLRSAAERTTASCLALAVLREARHDHARPAQECGKGDGGVEGLSQCQLSAFSNISRSQWMMVCCVSF